MKVYLSTKVLYVVIVLLIVVAIGLGIGIYIKSGSKIPFSMDSDKNAINENDKSVPATFPKRALPAGLTEEERAVFSNELSSNPTDEEKNKFLALIEKAAVRTNYLNISQCAKPFPLVLQIEESEDLTVLNDDMKDHDITFSQNQSHTIGSGKRKVLKANFGMGPGIYGYSCDGSVLPSGYLFITSR